MVLTSSFLKVLGGREKLNRGQLLLNRACRIFCFNLIEKRIGNFEDVVSIVDHVILTTRSSTSIGLSEINIHLMGYLIPNLKDLF